MKTIVFLNNKGGVGKTASVTTIAHMLAARHGMRVLVADIDPQGNASNLFGTTDFIQLIKARREDVRRKETYHIGDLLVSTELDPREVIRKTAYDGLWLLPSYPTLAAIEEKLKADIRHPQQFRLKEQLDRVRGDYDFCLIDCAPSLSILNINALVAADEVYIPTLTDDGSLFGIELTMTELVDEVKRYAGNLSVGGIFFTKFRSKLGISRYAQELLDAVYSELILPFTINENVAVAECSHKHMPLLAYDPGMKVKATRDYAALTAYIAAKQEAEGRNA
ncbi:ParA family protein [Marvinbryantia formatexigens]|nr:ParA family protein [Marvinbryantia formatexigens]UWO25058.1 ParA family protein [Marvinbryantia formatexigens DSM 14469]SDG29057.1 chromosome partitioning protein [Marvinbryantia formatexigens]